MPGREESCPPEEHTLGDLMRWWLEHYSSTTASHSRNENAIRTHILSDPIAEVPLARLRSAAIELFLQQKSKSRAPGTVNHMRTFISVAFNRARQAGFFEGPNPALEVRRRRVPRRAASYLSAEEVPRVLTALDPHWRPLFATAIYTGLRKGELFGLRKIDVDRNAASVLHPER